MKHVLLLSLALCLSLPSFAQDTPPPPDVELLKLEQPLPTSAEVGIPSVIELVDAGGVIPPVEKPSVLGEFFKQFVTPTGIASTVVTLLGLIGGALGLSALRKRQIAIVTQHAFNAIEDFSATTETSIDDKVAAGLKVADDWMKAQGWRALKPGEADVVRLGFSALNGTMKAAEKVAANAQVEATKALTSPAVRHELEDIARGNPRTP